jgi:hypothetical protein
MAEDEGVGLDFLTQAVNVQWEGGLAVEFFDNDGPPEPPEET